MFVINHYEGAGLVALYDTPPIDYLAIYKAIQVLFAIALVWLLRKLKNYNDNIRKQFSYTDPIQLNWLRITAWFYLAITLASFVVFLISNIQLLPLDIESAYIIINSLIVLAIFYMSFFGIRHYTIAEYYGAQREPLQTEEVVVAEAAPDVAREKYRTSSIGQEQEKAIYEKIQTLFAAKPMFLEPKLQLQDVADELGVSTHHLSQAINAQSGKPFYDLVNSYRVRHLQKLLADPGNKKFTILALGLDSGFNSKASLNRVFKEETGLSPSEYQSRHAK